MEFYVLTYGGLMTLRVLIFFAVILLSCMCKMFTFFPAVFDFNRIVTHSSQIALKKSTAQSTQDWTFE